MESLENRQGSKPKLVGLGDWELNVLMLESVVFAGLVMAGVWALIYKLWHLAQPVAMAIGFFAGEWASYPMVSVYGRSRNHRVALKTELVMSTTAAAVGGSLFWLLSVYWH